MTRVSWAGCAAALVLAGCLSGSTPQALPVALPVLPQELDYRGCSEQFGVFPTPMMDVQGMLPEGFKAVAFDPLGLFGIIGGLSFTCRKVSGMADEPSGVSGLEALLVVDPPAEFKSKDVQSYVIPLGIFTSSRDIGELYESWDFPVSVGPVDSQILLDLPVARLGAAQASDANVTVQAFTAVEGPAMSSPAGKARTFGIMDKKVTKVFDIAWNASSAITLGEAVAIVSDKSFPLPLPLPGLASHFWGPEYSYQIIPRSLDEVKNTSSYGAAGVMHGIPMPQPVPGQATPLLDRLLAR